MSVKSLSSKNKVGMVGCGKVGMSAAYAMVLGGVLDELVLLSRDKAKIAGEELDLEHGSAYLRYCRIQATDDYRDLKDSRVVVITAGAAQQPGEDRLSLAQKNLAILKDILPKVTRYANQAVIVIVTNPVDILTYQAYQISDLSKGRIFGTGTTLDSARFRFHLSEYLNVNPKSIHAYVLGEHGDSSFPVMSSATVGGQPLLDFPDFSPTQAQHAFEKARQAAAKIIKAKGSTSYGIGTVIAKVVETILKDSKTVLPVSVPLHNYHGLSGVALSVPCVIGKDGVERILKLELSAREKALLYKSAHILRSYL